MDIVLQIVSWLLDLVFGLLSLIISPLPMSDEFARMLDGAFAWLINTIAAAGWILPLDTLVVCFGVIVVVDNYTLAFAFIRWIVGVIRG